jgi:protein-S-isoprenylcysteine O-methyltransferase Ste14
LLVSVLFRDSLGPGLGLAQWVVWAVAAVCLIVGAALALGGIRHLGRNLTAFPRPLVEGELVRTGMYARVRHPIYSGGIFVVLGWALLFTSLPGVLMALVVFLFFDLKSRREEAWLLEKYAGYAAYRQQVRKLIPFIY